MTICVVESVIDPAKIEAFERFGRRWIELVASHGVMHNVFFLPAEGASDKALALFSFPSLAAYEQYRALFGSDPDFIEADHMRDQSGCVLRYERTFMRPLLPGHPAGLAARSELSGSTCSPAALSASAAAARIDLRGRFRQTSCQGLVAATLPHSRH